MPRSYLPQPLSDLQIWADNFAALITANPATYGLAAGDAATIQAAVDAFDAAYLLSTAPGSRTAVTIQATIDARNALVAIVRNYARIILANSGVSSSDKTDLGLIIRDPVNTPIPTPATNPVLNLLGATPGQLTLGYQDSTVVGKSKAKPFGATQLLLFVKYGSTPPSTPGDTPFNKVVTKSPFFVDTTPADPGDPVYVYARWQTAKGLVGPWSPLVTGHAMAT
jgi:hypothetical protein